MNNIVIVVVLFIVLILILMYVLFKVSSNNTSGLKPIPLTPLTPPMPTYTPWKCATNDNKSWNILRRNSDGLIMCMANDGKNCIWFNNKDDCANKLAAPGDNINPLICGAMNKSLWGEAGVDDPKHWCYTSRTDV